MPPRLSILIPTYNGRRFILETIASAQDQTIKDIEIIVGDDGSTDGTPEMVEDATALDERVRVLRLPHTGPNLNTAGMLRYATAPYTKWLLHDDLIHPEHAERLLVPLEQDPSLAYALSKRSLIDEDGNLLPDVPPFGAITDRPGTFDPVQLGDHALKLGMNILGEVSVGIFKTELLEYRPDLWSWKGRRYMGINDLLTWLMLGAQGGVYYDPFPLTLFRQHPGQATHKPEVQAGGVLDWGGLLEQVKELGYLQDPKLERYVWNRSVHLTATLFQRYPDLDGADAADLFERAAMVFRRPIETRKPATYVLVPDWNNAGQICRVVADFAAQSNAGSEDQLVIALSEDSSLNLEGAFTAISTVLEDVPCDDPNIVISTLASEPQDSCIGKIWWHPSTVPCPNWAEPLELRHQLVMN